MAFLNFEKKPNIDQQAFIDDFENNILLFAPAGSGKTFSVAKKIEKALSSGLFSVEDILCLTYTEKARDEMQNDIEYYASHSFQNIYTIHGFCLKTLREEAKASGAFFSDMRVIDKDDTEELIRGELLPAFSEKVSDYYLKTRLNLPLSHFKTEHIVYVGQDNIVWNENGLYYDYFARQLSEERAKKYQSEQTCPYCGKQVSDFYCDSCKADARTFFPVPEAIRFDFYEFMTKVRHERELRSVFSDDPERDFSNTIAKIKENPKLYHSCMAQKKQGCSETVFGELMDVFGGWMIHSFLNLCAEKHAIDFDEMIIGTLHLFEQNKTKRDYRYKMILVDEMQDTSELEFRVLRYLLADAQIIFCGDYFQTIYEWRGSKPDRIIGALKRDYAVKEYFLRENYRSTVLLSNASYSYLKNAFPSHSYLAKPTVHSKVQGDKIVCADFVTEEMQNVWIYNEVKKYKNESVCLMCRSNYTANELYRRLSLLPKDDDLFFFSQDEQRRFYLNPGMKDFLAFLHILIQPYDEISMERIAERFIRGIGKKKISSIRSQKSYRLTDFLQPEVYEAGDYYSFFEGNSFVVYDLETTGLDVTKDEMIQIAAIKFDRMGNELGRMNELIVPSVPIGDGALKTHNKSLAELKEYGTRDIKRILLRFSEFVKDSYLFGHNSSAFDRMILTRQLAENGLPVPNTVGEGDTLLLSKRLLPHLPDHKLETLCNVFSVVNENAHDAFSDVKATKEVFLSLAQCIPSKEERRGFYASYAPAFRSFYEKYRELQTSISQNDRETVLEELHRIVTSKRNNRDDKVFKERWKTVKRIFPTQSCCLSTDLKTFLEESDHTDKLAERLSETHRVIPIVTVHQTKGCEYDNVFLFQADDEHFPSTLALRSGQELEERRLFYVAMTRAKKRLFISYVRQSLRYPGALNEPTRYLSFIDPNYLVYFSDYHDSIT